MKWLSVALVTLVMTAAACSSTDEAMPTRSTVVPFESGSSVAAAPILGAWRRENTCEELVAAYTAAGVEDFIPEGIDGMNFRHDPRKVIAQDSDVCRGAQPVERTDILRANGYFINYEEDRIADDCRCYTLLGDNTFVILGDYGDPDISMRYTIRGATLRFKIQIPDPCSTSLCRAQVAFAIAQYGLGPWRRVDV